MNPMPAAVRCPPCEREQPCYVACMARETERSLVDDRPTDADVRLVRVVRRAVGQFKAVSGLTADSLSGLRPESDGWSLLVDVVELERIPLTLSILATYRVDTDRDGHMVSYERLRRFTRDATD